MPGDASYFNYETEDGKVIKDIAWYVHYPSFYLDHGTSIPAFFLLVPRLETAKTPVGIHTDARFYPTPMKGAESVAGRVAFYVGKEGLRVGVPPV